MGTGKAVPIHEEQPMAQIPMDNALFYTFSTIAQALAAAFALLGAFVLYKLQQLSTTLAEVSNTVILPYLPNEDARRLRANGLYPELQAFLLTQPQQNPEALDPAVLRAARNAFATSLAARSTLMDQLSFALKLTAAVIAGAILVLALTPLI
jgi:hypothetical protein